MPGAGASVTAFTDLAQALDPDIAVHGLQPRGLCGLLVPHIDVPSAARMHLRAVREVQPRGPYRLLGHSFGGWVATEMARRLEAAGEAVGLLVVLDSRAPVPDAEVARHLGRVEVLLKLVGLFEEKLRRPLHLGAADFEALDPEAQLTLLLARLIESGVMPRGTRIAALRGVVRAFATNVNTRYVLDQPYAGRVHLVAATPDSHSRSQRLQPTELFANWRRCAPATELWTSKGNHMTLLNPPHVGELATWLNPLMKELQCLS